MKKACIISIGNELLSGLTVDTNSTYLSAELLAVGVPTAAVYGIGDDVGLIAETVAAGAAIADIVLITGGLGPTDDDITRQGLADYLGVELEFREDLMEVMRAYFAKRKYPLVEKNRVQAFVPVGSEALPNSVGTAPGIWAEREGKVFVCMPGVPGEMKRMFGDHVIGRIEKGEQIVLTRKLRCIGVGESMVAEMLGDMMNRERQPLINCTVADSIITLHIVAGGENEASINVLIDADELKLRELLGDYVFGVDGQSLAEVVGGELTRCGKTIATAESCTGGLIAKMLTDGAGATGFFGYGWATYCNEAKVSQLGVDKCVIDAYGAVSEEVAVAMAKGARQRSGADFGVGVTGIAGPGGGSEQKPVGLVYVCVDFEGRILAKRSIFSGNRGQVRLRTALTALNMVRLGMKV
jgi:nicotinamide-nucleotide amidase